MKPITFFLICFLIMSSCQQESAPSTQESPTSDYYTETHRPQFHFSPETMWMNDPNGMVYYDGEYHLFYQYYPDDAVWGPMHWGHAVSPDMVHWEHLPIVLYPDEHGYIFSGSAVVDKNNTTGFKKGEYDPLVAIFTYHDTTGERAGKNDFQTQGIAYSNDRGRTWTKYEGNPVIPNPGIRDFRDPKVSWHEASQQWVMIFARGDRVQMYNSPNLIHWTLASEFGEDQGTHGGVWECPDLFELPIEGEEGASKWVMLLSLNPGGPNGGSATMYFVGDFDGKTFSNDNSGETVLWLDHGRDNYAGVTWSDIPKEDGRRLFMGWMSNWNYATKVPTSPWRSAMTIPRELTLTRTDDGLRVRTQPASEMQQIRGEAKKLNPKFVTGKTRLNISPKLCELKLNWEIGSTSALDFGVELSNEQGQSVRIGINRETAQLYIDRTTSGKMDFSETFSSKDVALWPAGSQMARLHLFIDDASVEVFGQNGMVVMTDIFFPDSPYTKASLYATEEGVAFESGEVWKLSPIW